MFNVFFTFFFRLNQKVTDRKLLVLMPWLGASSKHLQKYIELYNKLDFDIVVCQIENHYPFMTRKWLPPLADDLVKFIASNDIYKNVAVHGFSMAGCFWAECLVNMYEKQLFEDINQRIKAQTWDCFTWERGMGVGIAYAYFNKNLPLMFTSAMLFTLYFKLTAPITLTPGLKIMKTMINSNITCPALIFASTADTIGDERKSRDMAKIWESKGIDVTFKTYHDSQHVQTFVKHKEEYIEYVTNHLKKTSLLNDKNILSLKNSDEGVSEKRNTLSYV